MQVQSKDMANAASVTRKTPSHILERVRKYRTDNREAVNTRRRKNAAAKRATSLEQTATEARAKLGRKPQTLNEWFPTQARFSDWAQLAREIGVCRRTVLDWRTSKHPAVRGHRRRLFEITGLDCFADAANWKPREKPARKIGERAFVPVLAELVVRCGLATRELQQLRTSQIQTKGIQLASGRLILFGDKWEEVSRPALDAWLASARPTNFLFFLRKPVDRNRPVSAVWVSRVLHASGVSIRERRPARLRHFAGDFARLGSGERFLSHIRRVHALSKSGASGVLKVLQGQRTKLAAKGQTLKGTNLDKAFDLLYPQKNTGGAPKGLRELTVLRIRLVAAATQGKLIEMKKELSPDLYPEISDASEQEQRARGFRSEYRKEIESACSKIAPTDAQQVYLETKAQIAKLTNHKSQT